MYENFVISTQQETFLFLEREGESVHTVKFDSSNIKDGGPNDEARSSHPLAKYGLGLYGLFEVTNSPWIKEAASLNRVHSQHSDRLFAGQKHFVACFKDVMFEVRCRTFEEVSLSPNQVLELISQQLGNLDEQD
jgi:hypothetical protein